MERTPVRYTVIPLVIRPSQSPRGRWPSVKGRSKYIESSSGKYLLCHIREVGLCGEWSLREGPLCRDILFSGARVACDVVYTFYEEHV